MSYDDIKYKENGHLNTNSTISAKITANTNDAIKTLTLSDFSLWDNYVKNHDQGSFFHLSGWQLNVEIINFSKFSRFQMSKITGFYSCRLFSDPRSGKQGSPPNRGAAERRHDSAARMTF